MAELGPTSRADEVVAHLRTLGSEENRQGMRRYGIRVERALGIPHGPQRQIAKRITRNHQRALELWTSGVAEARFIASLTADPKQLTVEQAWDWAADFDSWDIVDGVADLFAATGHWKQLIETFAEDDREFVRRTAFAMIAWATVHRKKEPEETFVGFLPLIERHAGDGRNFVKKAVNWALRSIGKRSPSLNLAARETAERLAASDDRTARWVGRDAMSELASDKTLERIARRAARRAAASADAQPLSLDESLSRTR